MTHRIARLSAALLLAALPAAAAWADSSDSRALACTAKPNGLGAAELACPIAPAPLAQVLRFHASFSGVHDDSFAALGVKLDGQALACGAGSQARLQGDGEGDALSCAIALPAHEQPRELRLQLVWHHAEPASYQLRFD